MANPTCRNCNRSADAGAYCSSCAAGIMASALNPHFRQDKGHFHGDQDPLPTTLQVNSACSGSPRVALHGVTI